MKDFPNKKKIRQKREFRINMKQTSLQGDQIVLLVPPGVLYHEGSLDFSNVHQKSFISPVPINRLSPSVSEKG